MRTLTLASTQDGSPIAGPPNADPEMVLVPVAYQYDSGASPAAAAQLRARGNKADGGNALISALLRMPALYSLISCSRRMSACPQCWASSRSTWRYTQRNGSGPRQ